MAGTRFDWDRGVQVEKLEDRPETIMAHVRKGAAAKFIPATKYGVCIMRVIGSIERRTQPQCPIESLRDRRGFGRNGRILGPHWAIRPIMNFAQRADSAVINPRLDLSDVGAVACGQKVGSDLGLPCRLND